MSFDSSISLVGQRAVAQLGRASEPTTTVVGGDAVDAYWRWAPPQPIKRTDTGVSQEGGGKPLARRIQILPARPLSPLVLKTLIDNMAKLCHFPSSMPFQI